MGLALVATTWILSGDSSEPLEVHVQPSLYPLPGEPRRGRSVDEVDVGVGHPRVAGAEVCGGLGALVIVGSTLEG
jgi:hypothetical protein